MQAIKTKFKKVTATPKGRIIVFSILVFLIAVIAAGLWYWNTHKKRIIRINIESAVLKKSNGLYKIKYDTLSMDEINGYLSISNLNLIYDSIRYLDLERQEQVPSILLKIYIPKISVSGVKTPRALIDKEIVGRKLEIINPVINIIYTNSGKDSLRVVPTKEVYEQILGNLNLIQADTVLISGAQITTSSQRAKKTGVQFQDVSITLVNVKVDSTSSMDTTRMLFAKEISITCGKLAWSADNKLYNYSANGIDVSSVSRHLHIKSFQIVPTMNEDVFVKSLPTQDDRFDISVSDIKMQNIDLPQLFEENFVADSLLISEPSIKIYRDLSIPRDKKNRVGMFPHQLMQTISVNFRIEKVILTNGFIEYKERHHISRQAGHIQYYNVYAAISNFTNDKNKIAINNVMTLYMNSKFLNRTPLKVTALFYLLNPKGRFDLNGSFGAMDATALNPITERTGLTRIIKGRINGMQFNLQGHNYGIDGRVKILYEDLKVAMLEKDKGSKELDKKSLSSFIGNIIIMNSNPIKNENVRVVQVHADRNVNTSFFNMSWKAIFKGVKETVGINK